MLRRTLLQGLPLVAATLPVAARLAWAQAAAYPDKPVASSCPSPPAAIPMPSRAWSPRSWTRPWASGFIVDNKAGAGGNLGMGQLARSEPDGYTLGMGTVSTHAINPTLYKICPTIRIRLLRRSPCS